MNLARASCEDYDGHCYLYDNVRVLLRNCVRPKAHGSMRKAQGSFLALDPCLLGCFEWFGLVALCFPTELPAQLHPRIPPLSSFVFLWPFALLSAASPDISPQSHSFNRPLPTLPLCPALPFVTTFGRTPKPDTPVQSSSTKCNVVELAIAGQRFLLVVPTTKSISRAPPPKEARPGFYIPSPSGGTPSHTPEEPSAARTQGGK